MDLNARRMALLKGWLGPRLTPEQGSWLEDQVTRIAATGGGPSLAMAISLAPRKLGKADLALGAEEMAVGRSPSSRS